MQGHEPERAFGWFGIRPPMGGQPDRMVLLLLLHLLGTARFVSAEENKVIGLRPGGTLFCCKKKEG
jgi:hypothetical protein